MVGQHTVELLQELQSLDQVPWKQFFCSFDYQKTLRKYGNEKWINWRMPEIILLINTNHKISFSICRSICNGLIVALRFECANRNCLIRSVEKVTVGGGRNTVGDQEVKKSDFFLNPRIPDQNLKLNSWRILRFRKKMRVRSVTFAFHYSGLENTTYYKYPLDSWVQWMTNYIARRTHLIDMTIEQHHYSTIR